MDENWHRWIWASVYKHFHKILTPDAFHMQGQFFLKSDSERYELRYIGPDFDYKSGDIDVVMTLNLAIITVARQNDTTAHMQRVGKGLKCFKKCLQIARTGPYVATDDDLVIGALQIRNPIMSADLQLPDPVSNLYRTTLETTYSGQF